MFGWGPTPHVHTFSVSLGVMERCARNKRGAQEPSGAPAVSPLVECRAALCSIAMKKSA